MNDKKLKIYLALNIGGKLRVKDIKNNLNIYQNIFYNALNNNQCIPEYLESLGFTLIDRNGWTKLHRVSNNEFAKRLENVRKERKRDYKDCVVNRGFQYKACGTFN